MLRNSGSGKKHIRILSIDGGGIRGIIPAEILAEIEKRTAKPVSGLFDLVAGTSTGGILALALCQPQEKDAVPAHSAAQMVEFYRNLGPVIFGKPWSQVLLSVDGLLRSRYSDKPIETALENFFGGAKLSESLTALLVPSYELTSSTPFFFRSTRARHDAAYDFPMKTVARATSAAPTYFPPESVSCGGTNERYLLVDGGVFANNPSACALVEARVLFPEAERFTVVSLGTGEQRPAPVMNTAENWGMAQWARPIIDTVLDGVSKTVDYQMRQLSSGGPDGTTGYYRLQAKLTSTSQTMDNSSAETLMALQQIALQTVKERSDDIDALCGQISS